MKRSFIIFFLAAVAVIATVAAGVSGPQRAKARYYYTQGALHQAQGNNDAAYEYFRKAWNTDTTYSEAATAYGSLRLLVDMDTLQTRPEHRRDLRLMRMFADRYPAEYFENQYYAYLTSRIDSLPEAARIFERLDSLYPQKTSSLIHLADIYMAQQQLDKALDALDRYEKREGHNPQIALKKAQFMMNMADTTGALNVIRDLVKTRPGDAQYSLLLGNFYDLIQQPDSAYTYFTRAEQIDPENGAAKLALAGYFMSKGDSVNYDKKIYEALLAEEFGLKEKTEILANYLQSLINDKSSTERGDYLFSVLQDQYPHEPTLNDLSARYSAAKGDFDDAVEKMSYAIDLDPANSTYWAQMMRYQIAGDHPGDAVKTYDKAITHFEPNADLKFVRASAAQIDKQYDKAIAIVREMIADIDPTLPTTDTVQEKMLGHVNYEQLQQLSIYYGLLGDIHYQDQKTDSAFLDYANSLVMMPNNAMSLNNYAYFLAENGGDLDKALKMSEEAVTQQPENDTYLDTYAWILFKKGDYKEALEQQKRCVEYSEKEGSPSSEIYEHYGDILFMNKEPDQALEYWKKALELDPDNKVLEKKVKHKAFFYN